METLENTKDLFNALIRAISDIADIAANGHTKNYDYVLLEDVVQEVKRVCEKHDLAIMQFPVVADNKDTIAVETIIIHVSGQSISRIASIPIPQLHGGCNISQAAGAAYTYLRRYALIGIFGIADMDNDVIISPGNNKKDELRKLAYEINAKNIKIEDMEKELCKKLLNSNSPSAQDMDGLISTFKKYLYKGKS